MVDHDEDATTPEEMLGRVNNLRQGHGDFMPGNGFLGMGIQASMPYSSVGRIAHHCPKRTSDKNRRSITDIALLYGWFTEGFDTADLKDAKILLSELAQGC